MNNLEFVADTNSLLAKKLANSFNKQLHEIEIDHFADSETFIKPISYENLKNIKNIFVTNQFYFSNRPILNRPICCSSINNQLFYFLFLIDFLKKIDVNNITAFLPYLPYSRQEQSSLSVNKLGLLELVIKFLKTAGVNKLIVCEMHAPEVIEKLDLEIINIDLKDFWLQFLKSEKFKKLIESDFLQKSDFSQICFVSPDKGGKQRNQKLAEELGSSFAFIEKKRVSADNPVALSLHGDVDGKTVIMIDDIIDTGKTAVKACEMILKNGAKKVVGCFSHAVLSSGATELIENSSFERVFITDTVLIDKSSFGNKFFVVSIDEYLAKTLPDLI